MSDHAHEWTENPNPLGTIDAYACTGCGETTARCGTCQKPSLGPRGAASALLICEGCAREERYVLEDIRSALSHCLDAEGSGALAATRYDRDRIKGSRSSDAPRTTVADVVDLLHQWADLWVTQAAALGTTIPVGRDPLDTLRSGIMWAAHHPGPSQWHGYVSRGGIRHVRAMARGIAGLYPRAENAPCVYCGGRVVRDWVDKRWEPLPGGLSEELRCTGCKATWTPTKHQTATERWDYTKRHHLQALPAVKPDHLVTLEEARLVWPSIPRQTINSWITRDEERVAAYEEALDAWEAALDAGEDVGEAPDHVVRAIPLRGYTERGVPLYRVGDLDAMAEKRRDDTRRGPKVRDRSAEGVA